MVGRIIRKQARGSQRMEFDLAFIPSTVHQPLLLYSGLVLGTSTSEVSLGLLNSSGPDHALRSQVAFQHIPGCCMVLADSLLSLSLNSHCLSGAEAQPCCRGGARRLLFQGYSKLGDQPPEPICKLSGPSFPLGCPGASHSEKGQPWPGCRPTSCYL